jgi:hypothetical protein
VACQRGSGGKSCPRGIRQSPLTGGQLVRLGRHKPTATPMMHTGRPVAGLLGIRDGCPVWFAGDQPRNVSRYSEIRPIASVSISTSGRATNRKWSGSNQLNPRPWVTSSFLA